MRHLVLLVLVATVFGPLAAEASAARPPLLWEAPEGGALGAGPGEFAGPAALEADNATGNIFVADSPNSRVEEFNVWGEFIRAWGWGVIDGAPEAQVCTRQTGCQAGIEGAASGQVAQPMGIAVDQGGNVWVEEMVTETQFFGEKSIRVQKFTPEGKFLLMVGGEIDKTTSANICSAADIEGGDTCGSGVPGTGNGQFAETSITIGDRLAVDGSGNVVVGDVERIQKFDTNGQYLSQVAVPGEQIRTLDADSAGNFYVTYAVDPIHSKNNVVKLSGAGAVLPPVFEAVNPRATAITTSGNLWVVEDHDSFGFTEPFVAEFDAAGNRLLPTTTELEEAQAAAKEGKTYAFFAEAPSSGLLPDLAASSACGIPGEGDLYVARIQSFFTPQERDVRAYGPSPDPAICPPFVTGPEITDQFAASIEPEGATLRARINPHFESDITYYVEYGTGKCSEGGCPLQAPLSPALLGGGSVAVPVPTKAVVITRLTPTTTYHFRFVAQSSGGGPVKGVGDEEAEGTFTTSTQEGIGGQPCPNEALRTGAGSFLPDCRAYEMVSPVDKSNGDIITLFNSLNEFARLDQAAAGGTAIAYSSYRAFADPKSAPYTSQYIASRGPAGWSTSPISPPRGFSISGGGSFASEYRAFTEDLCSGWLLHDTDPVLAPGAVEGFANLYRRDETRPDCPAPAGEFEALTTVSPPAHAADPENYGPILQGFSSDGKVAAFRVNDKLTNNGSAGTNFQCYESKAGKLRLVSVLPGGTANSSNCSIGTANEGVQQASLERAVSTDRSRIFWTASAGPSGSGKIYLRIGSKNPTVPVSAGGEALSGKSSASQFLTAAADGSRAIYEVGNPETGADLYEYDVATAATHAIAGEVRGILGASADAMRIYLVSEEGLDGATAGKPNLYLYEGGSFSFIGPFAPVDAVSRPHQAGSPVALEPRFHTSRVSLDGLHAAFMSSGSPTGYDNRDTVNGEPDAEVYRYSATDGTLLCVSCRSGGVRPTGRQIEILAGQPTTWGAAQIPTTQSQLYSPRVLSADGSRLFFESFEPLVGRDTNGKQDVYEWEEAGHGSCSEESGFFRSSAGGCIFLISSGDDPFDAELIDAGADGSDVFFTTGSNLVAQDTELIDLYDARVGGGFPPPPPPIQPCRGEACQSPAAAPVDQTPASATVHSRGNVVSCPRRRRKVVRHGSVRCLKKKHHRKHHHRKQANAKRGAG
jgi:hypothetical protein